VKFKVNLLKNKGKSKGNNNFSLFSFLEDLRLRFEIYYWGLDSAFAGEHISRIRLNRSGLEAGRAPGYDYELNLFGEDYRTILDVFLIRMKKQFAVAGIGLLSFGALLGIGAGNAEAVQKSSIPISSTSEKSGLSTAAIPHTQIETSMKGLFSMDNSRERFKLVYYHSNSAHTNVYTTHVNTGHVDNSHTNSWSNQSTHSDQWNNTPHQNFGGGHTDVSGDVPGDYIY